MAKKKVAIIGPGVVGTALALLLAKKGYGITGIAGRTLNKVLKVAEAVGARGVLEPAEVAREAELIFITTPDRAIAEVTREISRRGGYRSGQILLHMSGALPAEAMAEARQWGVYLASIHPLQSFASPEVALETLPGSFYALEGDEEAVLEAEAVVADLEGRPFRLAPGTKGLYHAGACIASNYLVAIIHLALAVWEKAGIRPEQGFTGLNPLLQGTLKNIELLGPVKALTGPIARGDAGTVKSHLDSLAQNHQLQELYEFLGRYTLEIAKEKGTVSKEQAVVLEKTLLKGVKGND